MWLGCNDMHIVEQSLHTWFVTSTRSNIQTISLCVVSWRFVESCQLEGQWPCLIEYPNVWALLIHSLVHNFMMIDPIISIFKQHVPIKPNTVLSLIAISESTVLFSSEPIVTTDLATLWSGFPFPYLTCFESNLAFQNQVFGIINNVCFSWMPRVLVQYWWWDMRRTQLKWAQADIITWWYGNTFA